LEVLVNNQSSIINKTVVVNRGEHVLVDISMSCGNQDSTFNLFFILLSLLLLFNEIGLLVAASITDIFTSSSITTAHV